MIHSKKDFLIGMHGRQIPYVLERPDASQKEKGLFVLIHGLTGDKDEYNGFYKTLSLMMVEEGYAVMRFDLPAHGDSTASGHDFSLGTCIADAISATLHAIEHTQ